ncbi:transcriptional regulator [Bernardetia litoralis DSM 6794]|uniref:Transcriptional regulator n=1 Tax=Bernardetia litoralis (strain ATCC 23117 / DSM 6794 / NBRC 15988 / NCIMB 1366 / Fx l1 / Sio-4) TaxID=880071 RepID=I4AN91_BERLS|nr:MarR family transcriptional regulator [Bernardetia litoralis]AFM05426.1 transcriptional regulator [Bernardetia litoralis DSM 6794]
MKIEEALKTNKFKSDQHKAMINIMFTASWLRNKVVGKLKCYGISQEQYNVLRILRGSYPTPLCAKDITDRMIDKNSNTTRIMDKLIVKKYINKWRGEVDRREVNISITDSGLDLLKEIDEIEAINKPNYLNLSDTESVLLSTLLDKLREEKRD